MSSHKIIVVMGVSGCGKTTVGQRLAEAIGVVFYDGDDFHPQVNIEKMASGQPLDDADREPWLGRLRQLIDEHIQDAKGMVLACSALKAAYREILGVERAEVLMVHLRGEQQLIAARMKARGGHFFTPEMLASQFAVLESPAASEGVLVLDVRETVRELVEQVIANL